MAKNAQPTFQTKLSETSGGKINDVVKPNGCCIPDLWKKFPRVNDPKAKKIISMNREKLFSMVKQASSRAEEKDLSVIIMMDVNKVSALDWRRTAHVAAAQMNKAHKLLDTSLLPPCHKISAMFLKSTKKLQECTIVPV